jgi:hypothetical protein
MIVLWDAALCNVAEIADVSEVLTAYIIRVVVVMMMMMMIQWNAAAAERR